MPCNPCPGVFLQCDWVWHPRVFAAWLFKGLPPPAQDKQKYFGKLQQSLYSHTPTPPPISSIFLTLRDRCRGVQQTWVTMWKLINKNEGWPRRLRVMRVWGSIMKCLTMEKHDTDSDTHLEINYPPHMHTTHIYPLPSGEPWFLQPQMHLQPSSSTHYHIHPCTAGHCRNREVTVTQSGRPSWAVNSLQMYSMLLYCRTWEFIFMSSIIMCAVQELFAHWRALRDHRAALITHHSAFSACAATGYW